jgi:hypothetical protein
MQAARSVAAAFVVLACGASARAAEPAAPPELALTWQAPATCPTAADVEHQFVRLLGGAGRVASGKHITATAAVRTTSPTRWILDLSTVLEGAAGKRSLSGDSCSSVASAAALILALMVDPAAAERAFETAPAPPPAPPPKPAPAPTVTAPAPPSPSALQLHVRAFAGFAMFPQMTAGGIGVGARHGRLFVDVLGLVSTLYRPESAQAPALATADFRVMIAGARVCRAFRHRWEGGFVGLCAGGELERLSGTGAGLASSTPQTATMLAGTVSVPLFVPIAGRLALAVDVGASFRTYRPRFVATPAVDGDPPVGILQVARAGGWAVGGLAISF